MSGLETSETNNTKHTGYIPVSRTTRYTHTIHMKRHLRYARSLQHNTLSNPVCFVRHVLFHSDPSQTPQSSHTPHTPRYIPTQLLTETPTRNPQHTPAPHTPPRTDAAPASTRPKHTPRGKNTHFALIQKLFASVCKNQTKTRPSEGGKVREDGGMRHIGGREMGGMVG